MRLPLSLTASLILVAPLTLISCFTPTQIATAQTASGHTHDHNHAHDYEHFYIGVDGLEVLNRMALT